MLILLLRFIRGFVCFEISGKYPERFINITARNSVRLWDVKRGSQSFTACMYMSDYIRIRPLARRAGVRLRIKSKKGAPSVISRYRGRVGVAVGACAFVITVFVMSMFIWSIDITGLDTLSVSDMQALLRDEGLYVGAFKPS
ncbi:MAG: sporulation protein YqfD, partial [Ruminococcus sp.]|nr:sporulation protein YqfD [Ruminococcus sp.]